MNNRERLLAVLAHQPPDRIPWIPRLELWYEARRRNGTMPVRWAGRSLREIERALGLGTPAREGRVFTQVYDGVEIVQRNEGERAITEYHTPVGTVCSVSRGSAELNAVGIGGRVEEYPLKTPADYAVWTWIVERARWLPTPDAYAAYDCEIGDDGLPMVNVGDVPFHHWMLELAGYDHAFYHLADYPHEVEHLVQTMAQVERERLWPVLAASPTRLLLHGVHLSSAFTPPPLFRRYILPYYEQLMPVLHAAGNAVTMHADNDTSLILELIERAGWDMVECFVTAPMVPVTLQRARAVWGDRVIIWGGVPSALLSPHVPEDEFRAYVEGLFDTIAPGNAFILGVADNVMPDSLIERVAWITETVERRGQYPVRSRLDS